jgi:hypothetical protein
LIPILLKAITLKVFTVLAGELDFAIYDVSMSFDFVFIEVIISVILRISGMGFFSRLWLDSSLFLKIYFSWIIIANHESLTLSHLVRSDFLITP